MALTHSPVFDDLAVVPPPGPAVSWRAIFAGAAGAAALSLILLILGTGLGLASVSPWVAQGADAQTMGWSAVLWITLTQLLAAGLGGYLAGRLRTRWADTQADEVYFRDTAHGFLAWAVATLATAALLTSVTASIVGGGVKAGATVAAGGAGAAGAVAAQMVGQGEAASAEEGMPYFVGMLFRPGTPTASGGTPAAAEPAAPVVPVGPPQPEASAAEVTAIFVNALRKGALPAEDANYLAQQVAQRTALSPQQAEQRVNDSFTRLQTQARETETAARDAADKARKASTKAALWLFISLLAGAFFASLAATFGGRQRDLA